jgi:hypothetical protein
VASKTAVCKGESVDLTASGAGNYSWNIPGASGASVNVTLPVDVTYNYAVVGTDANGCKDTANVTVVANKCTGISEQNSIKTSVYPNPTSGELTIELGTADGQKVEVTDVAGRLLLSKSFSGQKVNVDLSHFASGVYYIKVLSASGGGATRIVKQ